MTSKQEKQLEISAKTKRAIHAEDEDENGDGDVDLDVRYEPHMNHMPGINKQCRTKQGQHRRRQRQHFINANERNVYQLLKWPLNVCVSRHQRPKTVRREWGERSGRTICQDIHQTIN